MYLQAVAAAEYEGKEKNMTLQQRAHDIGVAFATCKMNSRDNSKKDPISMQTQITNFITDYTFAASEIISGKLDIDAIFKE